MDKEQVVDKINKLIIEGNEVLKTKTSNYSELFGQYYAVQDDIFNIWKNKINIFLSSDVKFSKSYDDFSKTEPYSTTFSMSKKYQNILIALKECIENDYIIFSDKSNNCCKNTKANIFIGHGHHLLWARIGLYLCDILNLKPRYFEDNDRTSEIVPLEIEKFVDDESIKFAIMTLMNEDETKENKSIPRQNVIDEAARFSTKLGRNRVILVVEKGVTIPSNLQGIIFIEFNNDGEAVLLKIKNKLEKAGII